MNKYFIGVFMATVFSTLSADAQVIMLTPRYGRRYQRPPRNRFQQPDQPKFRPSVSFSIGYGFPNQDKEQLADFYSYYKSKITQKGPLTGALDYRFNRNMSIGVMASHGTVSVPYYAYNDPSKPALTGSLDNWAFMVNLVRYMPVNTDRISPYLRTAIGLNTGTPNYVDESGNKVNLRQTQQTDIAYQVGLGAKFNLAKNAGIFVEAGYGKYLVTGGAFVKF